MYVLYPHATPQPPPTQWVPMMIGIYVDGQAALSQGPSVWVVGEQFDPRNWKDAMHVECIDRQWMPMLAGITYADGQTAMLQGPSVWVSGEQFDPEDQKDTGNTSGHCVDAHAITPYGLDVCDHQDPIGPLIGSIWQFSKDPMKCRLVQSAFDIAGCEMERAAIASELVGHVWESIDCMHANHVIQKCINTVRPEMAQFVIDELSQYGSKGVLKASRHRFGCRVMQRLFENCPEWQMAPIIEVLVDSALGLSSHTYGHYVMMHLFEYCGLNTASKLMSILRKHVSVEGWVYNRTEGNKTNSLNHRLSAVINKALTYSDEESCKPLAAMVLHELAPMLALACSRCGHSIVKKALRLVPAHERDGACIKLACCPEELRSNRYGRDVAAYIVELQSPK